MWLPSSRIRWILRMNRQLFESALQSGNFLIHYESGTRVDAKSKYSFIRWRNKIEPSSYRRHCIRDGNLIPRFSQGRARCKFRALYDACSVVKSWVLQWIPIRVRSSDACWIRIRLTLKFLNPKRKSCEFKNIRIRVWTGPKCLKNGSNRVRNGHLIRRRILANGRIHSEARPEWKALSLGWLNI